MLVEDDSWDSRISRGPVHSIANQLRISLHNTNTHNLTNHVEHNILLRASREGPDYSPTEPATHDDLPAFDQLAGQG